MELNFNTIKTNDIYGDLSPVVDEILLEYRFLNLTEKEFDIIFLEEIKKSKQEYNNNIDYKIYIENKIRTRLDTIVLKRVSDNKEIIKIINDFINNNFKLTNSYRQNLLYLEKLQLFFDKYQIMFYPDNIIDLLNQNKIINNVLEKVVNKNIKIIENNQIDELFNSANMISMIEIFCQQNNILIEDYDNIDINNLSLDSTDFGKDSVVQYLNSIANHKLLTREEEQQLFLQIRQGNERARQIVIESNLKLVVSIAKKYVNRGLDFLDLIQEGNIGLMKAIDKFYYHKGNKFSTCATWWIRREILKAIANKSRLIRIPVGLHNQISQYRRIEHNLNQKYNRKIEAEEVAEIMGIPVEKARKLKELQKSHVSLNTKIGDYKENEIGDLLIADETDIEHRVFLGQLHDTLFSLLKQMGLKERELKIIFLRNTEEENKLITCQTIADSINVSRERVRQIELNALRKIRKSSDVEILASFMDDPDKCMEIINEYRKWYYNNPATKKTPSLDEMKTKTKKKKRKSAIK